MERSRWAVTASGRASSPSSVVSRTPWVAIVGVGAVSALIAAIGLVDFLSYISGAGYLFVLFFASLAMIRLRNLYPDLDRPFRVPLFPRRPTWLRRRAC